MARGVKEPTPLDAPRADFMECARAFAKRPNLGNARAVAASQETLMQAAKEQAMREFEPAGDGHPGFEPAKLKAVG